MRIAINKPSEPSTTTAVHRSAGHAFTLDTVYVPPATAEPWAIVFSLQEDVLRDGHIVVDHVKRAGIREVARDLQSSRTARGLPQIAILPAEKTVEFVHVVVETNAVVQTILGFHGLIVARALPHNGLPNIVVVVPRGERIPKESGLSRPVALTVRARSTGTAEHEKNLPKVVTLALEFDGVLSSHH